PSPCECATIPLTERRFIQRPTNEPTRSASDVHDDNPTGGTASDLPARDAQGLRLRAHARGARDALRDGQEEPVERLDRDRLEPPGRLRGPGAQRAGRLCRNQLL